MSKSKNHSGSDDHPERNENTTRLDTRAAGVQTLSRPKVPLLDIIDFLPDATFVIDRDKKVIAWNRALEEMTGVRKEEMLGKGDYAYAIPLYGHRRPLLVDQFDHPESEITGYHCVRHHEKALCAEVFVPAVFGGRGGYLWMIAAPLLDDQGNVVGAIESIRDVTERVRAEQKRQESEDHFRSIIEQCPFSVQVFSPEGRVLHMNAACEQLWGITRDTLANYNLLEDRQLESLGLMPVIRRAFAGEQVSTPEIEYDAGITVPGRGHQRIVQGDFYPVRDVSGIIRCVILIHQDISERKRAEDTLRASEAKYKALIETTGTGFVILDPQGKVQDANAEYVRLTGYKTREEILGRSVTEWVAAPYAAASVDAIHRCLSQGSIRNLIVEHTDTQGRLFPIEINATAVQTPDGLRIIVLCRDVTDRKRAEDALRRRSEELTALNRLMQEINATLSLDRLIAVATETIAHLARSDLVLFFVREDDKLILKGQRFRDPHRHREEIPPHHVGQCLCGIAVASGKPTYSSNIHADIRCTMQECKRMGLTSLAAIPLQAGDTILGVLGLGWYSRQDLSECAAFLETLAGQVAAACRNALLYEQVTRYAVELERRVEERTAQLAMTNKELESFSYSVSHDLRAPVRRIDGFSQMLVEDYGTTLDDRGKDYLLRVRSECRRMDRLIHDLLSLSHIARTELSRKMVNLTFLARQVVAALRETDPQRRVEVVIAEGLTANADENLLRVVLENLLDNAWKFTRYRTPARIEVGVNWVDNRPVYFVRDNGAGFDMAMAGRLFGAFQRLHSDQEFEGTGIGLATVQRIIHRHGGRVWAEGQVDHGATFFFTLS